MRVLYCGTGAFGLPTLRAFLASDHEVVSVVTQPDRRSGRARRKDRPIPKAAREAGVSVLSPDRCNDPRFVDEVSALAPDVAVVVAYGQMIGKALRAVGAHGWINLHASLLPRYRGAAPIARALLDGCAETGVSVLRVARRVDAGDVFAQEALDVIEGETAGELEARLAHLGASLVLKVLEEISSGKAKAVPQDETKATRAPRLTKEEGRIDWKESADRIANMVRAFTPSPGARAGYLDERRLPHCFLIRRAHVEGGSGRPAGTVIAAAGRGIEVACGQGVLVITELQPAAGKRMSAGAFLNGRKIAVGQVLSGG